MSFIYLVLAAVLALHVPEARGGCYQGCETGFHEQMRSLIAITDSAEVAIKACQLMFQYMGCLEGNKTLCDPSSLQYVNAIITYMTPDYESKCVSSGTSTTTPSPTNQLLKDCSQKANVCYVTFNDTFVPSTRPGNANLTAVCQSLDEYTICLENLWPQCGQFMTQAINYIKSLQQQYSYACSGPDSPQTVTECVNDTMDCYIAFNASFVPAVNQYRLTDMCSAMDTYSTCLNTVNERQECRRYTQQAVAGIASVQQQYGVHCATDGGQQAQKCVTDFQTCYEQFNGTYFPAMHTGNMNVICSSVMQYSNCVEPLYSNCWQHIGQNLQPVRVMKEQWALQCDPEFQRLSKCQPLGVCLSNFAGSFSPVSSTSSSSFSLCDNLSSYFPCVESSLEQCKIPPEDTSVDFSSLGKLIGLYCKNLLGNHVLNTCGEFLKCTSGIVLISTPDPSAMFDASTWCSYMDMSLSCVERAVRWPQCGLSNDDTIIGHMNQQRNLKRDICKLSSVPSLTTESPNAIPVDNTNKHGTKAGQSGHDGSVAMAVRPVTSLAALAILSLVFQRLFL